MRDDAAPGSDASPKVTPPASIMISIDAMGGDSGPAPVVEGMRRAAMKNPGIGFFLHGPDKRLRELVGEKDPLKSRCVIRHAEGEVTMDAKPSQVLRHGRDTSMWSTIESLRNGEATVAVSCGNTGALMGLSMVRLRKLPGVNRPAIACLWPSRNKTGFAVMLDVGADIRADEQDLLQYALMGSAYARNGLGLSVPRVGVLNVGTEEHKGRAELKAALDLISEAAERANFECVGFVEGGDIPSGDVDVIVTDGFSGNVALKTAEGTASLIREFLGDAFRYTPLSRIASLLAYTSMRRLSKRIDPRRVNGGVFLGLNGTVVKSHGSADATGVAAAIALAAKLAEAEFSETMAAAVASTPPLSEAMSSP